MRLNLQLLVIGGLPWEKCWHPVIRDHYSALARAKVRMALGPVDRDMVENGVAPIVAMVGQGAALEVEKPGAAPAALLRQIGIEPALQIGARPESGSSAPDLCVVAPPRQAPTRRRRSLKPAAELG